MVVNNTELRSTLDMVLARLDGDPNSPEEWDCIERALKSAARYAGRNKRFKALEVPAPE